MNFFERLCMWIRRILFTLGMPLIILCGIVMFSDEEVKKKRLQSLF